MSGMSSATEMPTSSTRYARDRELSRANLDAWAAGAKPVSSLLAKPSHEARLGHGATEIIASLIAERKSPVRPTS